MLWNINLYGINYHIMPLYYQILEALIQIVSKMNHIFQIGEHKSFFVKNYICMDRSITIG